MIFSSTFLEALMFAVGGKEVDTQGVVDAYA